MKEPSLPQRGASAASRMQSGGEQMRISGSAQAVLHADTGRLGPRCVAYGIALQQAAGVGQHRLRSLRWAAQTEQCA